MGVEYNKTALQEYMDQISCIGEQMHRQQDESFSIYNSCKQQYNRIHTKLEEATHRAYNQVENAESMRRNAELEYENARKNAENAEDENTKNVVTQRMQQAQVMLTEADEEYLKASVAYKKASEEQKKLSDLWDGNALALESQVHRIEDGIASFSRLVANGNSDLGEYMSIMDKAQDTLHGNTGINVDSNGGSTSSGSVMSTMRTKNSKDNGQKSTDSTFKSNLGNTVGLISTANGLKNISMSIEGKKQTFPGTKSGIAKAYRSALNSGDMELASYTNQIFYDIAPSNESNDLNMVGGSDSVICEATNIGGASSAFSTTNNQIAEAMMTDGFVSQADFGKLDTRTAQDIQKSVSETLEMFQDIDLRFVGSVQSRNQHIEKSLEAMYFDAYRRHYPSASDEELMPFVKQQVAEDMNGFQPSNGTIAQSLFVAEPQTYGEEIIAGFNGISINERYGSDYNYFTHVRRSDVKAKWKPAGCNTPRATVDHELGHQIARLTSAHTDDVMQEMYSDFMNLNSTQRGEALSGYAGESIHEFIAEGWSEYRNNPNCRPLAKNISNRLFDLYNQRNPRLVTIRR